jgi:hypothetical protein
MMCRPARMVVIVTIVTRNLTAVALRLVCVWLRQKPPSLIAFEWRDDH